MVVVESGVLFLENPGRVLLLLSSGLTSIRDGVLRKGCVSIKKTILVQHLFQTTNFCGVEQIISTVLPGCQMMLALQALFKLVMAPVS